MFHGRYSSRIRGRGLGGILANISKIALPILKRVILPHAGKAVLGTATDILKGRNVRTSLKRRAGEAGKGIVRTAVQQITGTPAKKMRKRKVVTSKKRKYRDIFT